MAGEIAHSQAHRLQDGGGVGAEPARGARVKTAATAAKCWQAWKKSRPPPASIPEWASLVRP